jgi:hypothetical protein
MQSHGYILLLNHMRIRREIIAMKVCSITKRTLKQPMLAKDEQRELKSFYRHDCRSNWKRPMQDNRA